ncbi:uncharacterized protein LOC131860423 [Cryptomeria japonica]|uniref:uncharacterized protein LOC131860423 n=1 Tax=Cryptomeria japonica TaxID=3369 RepID=UPI0027DA8D96|nr:uncharacterized protein LOC131860423 [Cryptomeria japonica]
MRKSELVKKAADLGVIDGLGVVPLAKVLPARTTIGKTLGEGSQEEEEQREMDEDASTQSPATVAAQEEEQPREQHSLEGEKERIEAEDLLNERLVLTPQDQEDLLKEITVGQGMGETDKEGRTFGEEVGDRMGELHKQQQLNVDIAIQTNLACQIASPQDPEHTKAEEKEEVEEQSDVHIVTADIVPHEGDKDKDAPQWLDFTFERKKSKVVLPKVTLQ